MIEFFSSLLGYIDTLWQFFLNFIEALGTALAVLTVASFVPQNIVPIVPGLIGASIMITYGIYVVKFVTGR